jgi:hypothetical protein
MYRSTKSTVLISLAALFSALSTGAGGQTISGNGAKQCGVYMQAVKLQSDVAINGFISWAQGYISGVNATNTDGRDVAIDPAGLNYWLTNYCGAHQNDSFFGAVQQLTTEMGR